MYLDEWQRNHPKKTSARSGTTHEVVQDEGGESEDESVGSLYLEKD